mmetsp:Transcript_64553/g.209566  ORF Transcript_64553/g.209566 Transcript_64553/m.209566 type:complete len:752 (+) Transcript_64553:2-2257(+)
MAWRGKEAIVLLVDVGSTMCGQRVAVGGAEASRADVALGMARNIAQQKMLFMPKHDVGIVFFGTTGTCNDLQADGYDNVSVACGGTLGSPDLAMLRFLTQRPEGGAESDAVNGLIVALDFMIKKTRDQKYSKAIHLITDSSSASFGDADLEACIKQLDATSTKLHVTLVGATDVGPWGHLAKTSTAVQILPLPMLARRCSLSVKPVELRAKVRLQLIVSQHLQIPVGVYSRTTRVSFPTLKKRSKMAAALPKGDHPNPDHVVIDRTYHVADDPDGEEVVAEDRIKGHKYGQSIVPMSEYDEAALMYTCDRTLTALGFALATSIGPEHSMHQVETVAADRGDGWASCAFESLVDAMLEENLAIIARYSFRKNSQPRMVALMPRKGSGGNASIMDLQYLPFFEDLREWSCASLPMPSVEQRDAISALVDAMSLDASPKGVLDGAPRPHDELLKPEDSNNPCLARFYSFLVQRAIDPKAKVPPPGLDSWNHLELPAEVAQRLKDGKLGEALKAKFGLEKVEKVLGKKKHFWREAIAAKRKDLDFGEVDTKRIKVAVREDGKKEEKDEDKVKDEGSQEHAGFGGMAAPVGLPPVVHVGSVHPERDFERWLLHKSGGHDAVGEAMRQMRGVIERLADEGEDFHGKALSCLGALRKGCVQEAEAAVYNAFARALSRAPGQLRSRFWARARESGLGLITDSEVPTSTVTSEEASAFLRGEAYWPSSATASSAKAAHASTAAVAAAAALTEQDLEAMMD